MNKRSLQRDWRPKGEEVIQSQRDGFKLIAESKREILRSIDGEITDLAELLADGYVDRQRLEN